MKYLLIILLLIPTQSYAAVAPDVRISDGDCDVLDLTSDGFITISNTNETPSGSCGPGAKDRRICDAEGHCLNFDSNGGITIVTSSPY